MATVMINRGRIGVDGWSSHTECAERRGYDCGGTTVRTVHWWAHASRVGEARHPGPLQATLVAEGLLRRVVDYATSAIEYPRPGTGSLRGAVAPGFGLRERAVDGDELFALSIEAVNSTGWRALQRRLQSTSAHVILAQETWIMQDSIPAASAWAKKRGWKSIWSAAQAGPNGGATGGVATFAREEFGLRYPPGGSHEWHLGRVVAAVLDAPEHHPLLLVSSYLIHGIGPAAANLDILAKIGSRARAAARGMDMVMGGTPTWSLPTSRLPDSRLRLTRLSCTPPLAE